MPALLQDDPTIVQRPEPLRHRKENTSVEAIEVEGYDGELVGKVKDGGKEVAVKDMWLDEGSQTEWQNQAEVFERLKKISKKDYGWATSPLRSALNRAFWDGKAHHDLESKQ